MLHKSEKPAHQSKKFIAWLIQQVLMAGTAVTALVTQPELGWPLASFMVSLAFFMGASTMYFLGKQAALDTAVRGFAMVGQIAGLAGTKLIKSKPIKPEPSE